MAFVRAGLVLALALVSWPGAAQTAKRGCDAAAPAATVVYLGAWDCPYCTEWKSKDRPAFKASAESARVSLREIDTPLLKRPDFKFPADLAWLEAKYRTKRGVPRFLIVAEGKVLLETYGTSGWRTKTLPLLKELVAERTAKGC